MKKFLFITLALLFSSLLDQPTQAQTIKGSISVTRENNSP